MKDISAEEMIAVASIFSIELSKNMNKKQLIRCKTFFQTIANNLQSIINEKSDKH